MCGIAGVLLNLTGARASVLPAMLELISHRGPDDRGDWLGCGWHIGMTRLAIVDVDHGRQPMQSADGRWVLVMNGEIYNFRSLRSNLALKGVRFRTNADTEVLLELIAARGVKAALSAIEGMFAFAALDLVSGDLWLARDRFGEKPLYLDHRGNGFAFCSELSPLLVAQDHFRICSAKGVAAILRYGFPWPGVTAIEGIEELRPSEWLRRTSSGVEERGFYWHLPDRVKEEVGSIKNCGGKLLELLDQSVRERLIADVPLGLFLSGGIDSSAVAASARVSRPDIQAITVGFEDREYDERPFAKLTAAHLDIQLYEEQGMSGVFSPEAFDELLFHYGQPFFDTSAVPTRVVSRSARRHFKVVLSGDGGDELLAGYPASKRLMVLRKWSGGSVAAMIARVLLPTFPATGRTEFFNRVCILNAAFGDASIFAAHDGVFSDAQVLTLVEGTPWQRKTEDLLHLVNETSRNLLRSTPDPLLAMSLHQISTSLPQDILTKVDRMSMAESLEVRCPFLDSKLAEFVLSLPAQIKLNGKFSKFVLREALRGRVPDTVLFGPKKGFHLPVRRWMGDLFWKELKREVQLYSQDSAAELNVPALQNIIAADAKWCRSKNGYRALHRSVLVYSFLRWRRVFMDAQFAFAKPRVNFSAVQPESVVSGFRGRDL